MRKVELLNTPYRFYGFTIGQIVMLVIAVFIAIYVWTNMPNANVKVFNGLPLGFLVAMAIVCGAMVFVWANQIRPWQWWRNKVLYTLHFRPLLYVPWQEPAHNYPDANIIEPRVDKSNDRSMAGVNDG
jgi:hypothetical protein